MHTRNCVGAILGGTGLQGFWVPRLVGSSLASMPCFFRVCVLQGFL